MFFWEEDPFALHLVLYSCDRSLTDYAKQKNMLISFDWHRFVKPEYHQMFYDGYVETYDFLRHADRRPDRKLEVYDIAKTNELALIVNTHRYFEITKFHTEHTQQFTNFVILNRPQYCESVAPYPLVEEARDELGKIDHHTLFATYRAHLTTNPKFQEERRQDLCDLGRVYPLKA